MLHYQIKPHSLNQHLWEVTLTFNQADHHAFTLSLANWVPGSYMIRDFARHITQITAKHQQQPVLLKQIDKNTWQASGLGKWEIRYYVYAFDVSVRGSFLSSERGFFDGAALFLRHNQKKEAICQLSITNLPENWTIATSMPKVSQFKDTFQANSYKELIDYPFEMGHLLQLPFSVRGIEHTIVLSGTFADFDQKRLVNDVQKICQTEIALFKNQTTPFKKYTFLLFLGHQIYGGLEHHSSTALMADRHALPLKNKPLTDDYIGLLGLFSHEYFHAWNVKSIKPLAFAHSNLNQEAYTTLLWAFEGITSYYDDLFLVHSGVISETDYLNLLAKTITKVQQTNGRLHQTLAESSFSAWTKFYKQNENSPNAIVSYYQQGALAALCLDAYIRQHSNQTKSLDDVLRALYYHWLTHQEGLTTETWIAIANMASGLDLSDWYQYYIQNTHELALSASLQQFGIDLKWYNFDLNHSGAFVTEWPEKNHQTDFGARFIKANFGIKLTQIVNNGAAEMAGLHANDQLIGLNHEVIEDFNTQFSLIPADAHIQVTFVRDNMIKTTVVIPQLSKANSAILKINCQDIVDAWLTPQTTL